MNTFRILSIDGGGIKGVFPAAFLAELERSTSTPIHRYFDLIAGTSTGGIIALALGLGLPAADIVRFYKEQGPAIFSRPRRPWTRIFRPKYASSTLRCSLASVFGDATLGDSKVRLIVPSFSADNGEMRYSQNGALICELILMR